MIKIWNWFVENALPILGGYLVVFTAILLLLGAFLWSIRWVLSLLGVI